MHYTVRFNGGKNTVTASTDTIIALALIFEANKTQFKVYGHGCPRTQQHFGVDGFTHWLSHDDIFANC